MIFVDSNIPMYLVGGDHPNRLRAQYLLERSAAAGTGLVTDAEVLQEILHRYISIRRPEAVQPAFDVLLGLVRQVYPIDRDDVQRAFRLVGDYPAMTARDAIHIAVMLRYDVERVMSFDRGLDGLPGIARME